jgi:hypothetical protein
LIRINVRYLPIGDNEPGFNGGRHVFRYDAGDCSCGVGVCGVRRRSDLGRFSNETGTAKDSYDFSTTSKLLSKAHRRGESIAAPRLAAVSA